MQCQGGSPLHKHSPRSQQHGRCDSSRISPSKQHLRRVASAGAAPATGGAGDGSGPATRQVLYPLFTRTGLDRVTVKQLSALRLERQKEMVVVEPKEQKLKVLGMLAELTATAGLENELRAFVSLVQDPTSLDLSALVSKVWDNARAYQGRESVTKGSLT
ncbi:hypothetical protein DUNSADRAFT_3670 [Dunaliella salina]|uniref:Uncharacterized protein n=1 Tax=Dunaliella salina TaxID=3046 RepID=A0ABQ7GTL9_DUNSA|nr:hypothetical protein DUNSADRAFT_3670 [Dunaliella salina]|eukprot:KAF5837949.1 hypothetical protein DUNSADRAFT_3670 [Dunaliella salina]